MTIQRSTPSRSRPSAANRQRVRQRQKIEAEISQTVAGRKLEFQWANMISNQEWSIYQMAAKALEAAGVPVLLGGGFSLAAYTGRWRDTKDIDFYVLPEHRSQAIAAMADAGFADFYHRLPYDRNWIYRSVWSTVIVDLIWAMANQRAQVDRLWFERAGTVEIRQQKLKVVPAEELLWCKLYILQRDHCDWTDAFNLLYALKGQLDWGHLLSRLNDDRMLLKAFLTIYTWLCPEGEEHIPASVWRNLRTTRSEQKSEPQFNRIRLLDSRTWFASLLPPGGKLEV